MKSLRKRSVAAGAALVVAVGFTVWAVNDFNDWKSLGKGGLEHNLLGWASMSVLRPLKGNPLDIEIFSAGIGAPADVQVLNDLPVREGSRPHIARHPIPHRQLDQIGDSALSSELHQWLQKVAEADALLDFRKSHTEKHNDALWMADVDRANPAALNNGEIAHVHQTDGSTHVILSPSDAKIVLEAGWGELHSLSGIGGLLPSPTYVLLYSPRDEAELEICRQIVTASVRFTKHEVATDDQ